MDRLTTRREDGSVVTTGQTWSNWEMCVVPCSRGNDRYDIRLAEYEDTGLTPEEILKLIEPVNKAEGPCGSCRYANTVNETGCRNFCMVYEQFRVSNSDKQILATLEAQLALYEKALELACITLGDKTGCSSCLIEEMCYPELGCAKQLQDFHMFLAKSFLRKAKEGR